MGERECLISLHDPEVGEFMICVKGTGLNPLSLDQVSFVGTAGVPIEKTIKIASSNLFREKAIHTFLNLPYGTTNPVFKSRSASHKEKSKSFGDRILCHLPKQYLTYQVKYLSPFITGPSEIVLKSSTGEKTKLNGISESNYSELPICFSPKVK
jgi:hypothetical protein